MAIDTDRLYGAIRKQGGDEIMKALGLVDADGEPLPLDEANKMLDEWAMVVLKFQCDKPEICKFHNHILARARSQRTDSR